MPPGWQSENGIVCVNVSKQEYLRARGADSRSAPLARSSIVCSVIVTAVDDAWFLTAFIFWIVTLLANLLMGVGTFGGATTARELEEALVARGAFSSSIVLAYVFVVPANPHSLPIPNGVGVPTSTVVFVIGLVCLTASSFYSFILAKTLTIILRERDSYATWYEPFLLQQSLIEDLGDLMQESYRKGQTRPGASPRKSRSVFQKITGMMMKSRTVAGDHVVVDAISTMSAHDPETMSAHDPEAVDEAKAQDLGSPSRSQPVTESGDVTSGGGRPSTSADDPERRRKRARIVRTRTRIACFDLSFWSLMHLVPILMAAVILADASNQYKHDISLYKAAALQGTDAASASLQPGK
mmetsp:Transcript_2394/g.6699  ORF Transcript_2394/g.6699 Transcript_2394/m.6699 type:complete len:354 (-) Transcript_2394:577-1638(-)